MEKYFEIERKQSDFDVFILQQACETSLQSVKNESGFIFIREIDSVLL